MRTLLLALVWILTVSAQDPDPAAKAEKFREYLERQPFHEAAFDRMVEASVAVNGLGSLVERYETAAAAAEPERATRILLARLYAVTERHDEALAVLEEVEGDEPELLMLRGTFALAAGRPDKGVTALDEAAASAQDPRLLERIHLARGRACMARRDRDGATAAFRDVAAIDPADYHLRIAAADALAGEGLVEAAIEEYGVAAELAADDAARRCRALAAGGRLLESLGRVDEALALYAEAIELLGRGHWLRDDLFERTLAVHRREGTLAELVMETRATVSATVSSTRADLDRRELLADALEELRDYASAAEVLAAATRDFPEDLELGRRYGELLARLEDPEAQVAEYQRLIERHPRELELYLDLGSILAREGRLEQARRQWERTLELRLDDAGFCVRLANLYALNGLNDEAARMIEQALELEPLELRHYGELASVYLRSNRRGELDALLARAEAVAGDDPGRLEELADLARGLDRSDLALSAIGRALEGEPGSVRRLYVYSEIALEMRDVDGAFAALRRIITDAAEDNERRQAANRLLRLRYRHGGLEALVREEEARVDQDPSAHLVLAKVHLERRDEKQALAELEAFVSRRPEDSLGRKELARVYADAGRDDDAVAQYRALIEARPAARVVWLKEIAKIQRLSRAPKEAKATWDQILGLSPDNPATFAEGAGFFFELDEYDRAAECLRQAIRLRPDDGHLRLELAAILREEGRDEEAYQLALAAAGDENAGVRDQARNWIYDELVLEGRVEAELDRLGRHVTERPYDREAADALIDLLIREFDFERALDQLTQALAYAPNDLDLLLTRAELFEELKRFEEALADYDALSRLPDVDREAVLHSRAACALALGDKTRADEILLGASDPAEVARTYARFDHVGDAYATLERALVLAPTSRPLLQRLVSIHEQAGDREKALEVQERLLQLDGEDWERLNRALGMAAAGDDRERARDYAARMLATLATPAEPNIADSSARKKSLRRMRSEYRRHLGEVESQLRSSKPHTLSSIGGTFGASGSRDDDRPDMLDVYEELLAARLVEQPADEDVLSTYLRVAGERQTSAAKRLEVVEGVRAGTVDVLPPGRSKRSWTHSVDRTIYRLIKSDEALALERADALAGESELTRKALDERVDLIKAQGDAYDLIEVLETGVQRFPARLEYRAGLAITLLEQRELTDAEGELRELIRELEAKGGSKTKRYDDERAERSSLRRAVRKYPAELQELATEEHKLTIYRLSRPNPLDRGWPVGRVPTLLNARLALAAVLSESERQEEAGDLLAEIEPKSLEYVEWAAYLAEAYEGVDLHAQAARLRTGVSQVVERVTRDPVLRHACRWRQGVRAIVGARTQELVLAQDYVPAYRLMRRWEGPELARKLLDVDGVELEELVDASKAAWQAALISGDVRSVRDAGVLCAELLFLQERYEKAVEVLAVLYDNEPDDGVILEALARMEEYAGRPEAAIALHEAKMEERTRHFEETGEDLPMRWRVVTFNEGPTFDPLLLDPEIPMPGIDGQDSPLSRMKDMSRIFRMQRQSSGPDLVPHNLELFRIAYVMEDWERFAAVIRALQQDSTNFSHWVGYMVREVVQNRELGDEALELFAILYEGNPTDGLAVRGYGERLVTAGRAEEARRIYRKFLRGRNDDEDYWARKIREDLDELEGR